MLSGVPYIIYYIPVRTHQTIFLNLAVPGHTKRKAGDFLAKIVRLDMSSLKLALSLALNALLVKFRTMKQKLLVLLVRLAHTKRKVDKPIAKTVQVATYNQLPPKTCVPCAWLARPNKTQQKPFVSLVLLVEYNRITPAQMSVSLAACTFTHQLLVEAYVSHVHWDFNLPPRGVLSALCVVRESMGWTLVMVLLPLVPRVKKENLDLVLVSKMMTTVVSHVQQGFVSPAQGQCSVCLAYRAALTLSKSRLLVMPVTPITLHQRLIKQAVRDAKPESSLMIGQQALTVSHVLQVKQEKVAWIDPKERTVATLIQRLLVCSVILV